MSVCWHGVKAHLVTTKINHKEREPIKWFVNGLLLTAILATTSAFAKSGGKTAEQGLTRELMDCAAYYQIASEAVAAANVPQMQNVAQKLAGQSQQAQTLAAKYSQDADLAEELKQAQARQVMTMKDARDLRGLMARYQTSCKQVLADPQQRLQYWIMATM
ncbi:hypothetical protein NFHSH190041_22050 [Shewanella sp. NFH-SH190041]|uniref:hypothetical protein n=1 Tax=Shewanella sp. NFH-SH190041 TaxID=2950245 RepID=UPI0021C2C13E|nr:hypothetical protein [Shewanella sp. NFH-SH190041]BDM64753.1 hypothetical protein NFHSH190041_22050 [Shewanella sp. NFH-SH190041]